MKTIKTEIEQYMTSFEASGTTVTSRFVFPEEFVGFKGHFPHKKVLPGVCQIQCALATIERAIQKSVELREITLAKYFSPVAPGEEITCVCSDLAPAGEFTVKVKITKVPIKVAELKLRVALIGEEKNS